MGTRNLTAVFLDGEYKIAQYGQWDGYPDGAGLTCLHFLRDECNMQEFKEKVSNVTFISEEDRTALLREFGMRDDGTISWKDYDRFKASYPELHRDVGSDILEYIYNRPTGVRLGNEIDFAADGLFCEWAWVVDLDAGTFEAYEGFNSEPLKPEDRFYFLRDKESGKYHGVKMVAKWDLNDLPSDEEFLSSFKEGDKE